MTQKEFNRLCAEASLPFVELLNPLFPGAELTLNPTRLIIHPRGAPFGGNISVYYGRRDPTGDLRMRTVPPFETHVFSLPAKKWIRDSLVFTARLARSSVAREVSSTLRGYLCVFEAMLAGFKNCGKEKEGSTNP